MKLRLESFRVRDGRREFRVVRPRPALRHTAVCDPQGAYGFLYGDHDGLSRTAALFSFAAYSRNTVVHLPLRSGVPLTEERFVTWSRPRVDLVLVHHSLGLRVSRWPAIRQRLVHGRPLTVTTNERRTAADAAAWSARWGHLGQREWLRPVTYARTLFLTGSRGVFASAAEEVAYAAGWGPREKGVAEGRSVRAASLTNHLVPDPSRHHAELDILFAAYPPYEHFARPS
ncbi:hypothetical protein AB0D04_07605 [Streptomyces sp. NPDC048483]|uniref:hypothetical protein n=1 Tax=Streptomyces sp. NPDC048483 TaxID=3154927 RepID=UPI003422354A